MKKILYAAIAAMALCSCGNDTDLGTLSTSVNKSMRIFDPATGRAVIYEATGRGQIENIYLCGDDAYWHNPEQCVLNVYCDGQLCVSGNIYELVCLKPDFQTQEEYRGIFLETPLFSKLGARNSMNLNFKIPYYKSCKVELVQPGATAEDRIWTTVRASDKIDISYGGRKLPKGAYFKAIRMENETLESGGQFTVMESSKRSMVTGLNLFVDSETTTTLEACLRAYDTRTGKCNLLSSGLEDFFLGTFYFDAGPFLRFYDGITCFKAEDKGGPYYSLKLAAYRVLTENPLCFNHPAKITVRNGEQNEIGSDSEIKDDIYLARGKAVLGAICFYYEW